jgi:hypothetical protein
VFGHVRMHAHQVFADFLERYGELCARTRDAKVLEQLGRIFWYTVEFGMIWQRGELKMFGSGIISSHAECSNVLEGNCEVRRFEFNAVLETTVKVDEVHKVLFALESFDQMYEALLLAESLLFDAPRGDGESGTRAFMSTEKEKNPTERVPQIVVVHRNHGAIEREGYGIKFEGPALTDEALERLAKAIQSALRVEGCRIVGSGYTPALRGGIGWGLRR